MSVKSYTRQQLKYQRMFVLVSFLVTFLFVVKSGDWIDAYFEVVVAEGFAVNPTDSQLPIAQDGALIYLSDQALPLAPIIDKEMNYEFDSLIVRKTHDVYQSVGYSCGMDDDTCYEDRWFEEDYQYLASEYIYMGDYEVSADLFISSVYNIYPLKSAPPNQKRVQDGRAAVVDGHAIIYKAEQDNTSYGDFKVSYYEASKGEYSLVGVYSDGKVFPLDIFELDFVYPGDVSMAQIFADKREMLSDGITSSFIGFCFLSIFPSLIYLYKFSALTAGTENAVTYTQKAWVVAIPLILCSVLTAARLGLALLYAYA